MGITVQDFSLENDRIASLEERTGTYLMSESSASGFGSLCRGSLYDKQNNMERSINSPRITHGGREQKRGAKSKARLVAGRA